MEILPMRYGLRHGSDAPVFSQFASYVDAFLSRAEHSRDRKPRCEACEIVDLRTGDTLD